MHVRFCKTGIAPRAAISPRLRVGVDAPWTFSLPIEDVARLTAQHLHLTVDDGNRATARYEELKASPAWADLPAVRLHQVYRVEQQWFFASMYPLGKRLMLKQLAMTFIR